MPEISEKNPSQGIVSEIELLEKRLQEKRTELENQKITQPEKETLSQVIKERAAESVPLIPANTTSSLAGTASDTQNQLQTLVNLAFTQNIPAAVAAAKHSGSAFLIDALHDALVDKFYMELQKLGKIK